MEAFIDEKKVCESLRVSRKNAKGLRDGMERGVDWDYIHGRVVYSESGAKRLLAALDADIGVETLAEGASQQEEGEAVENGVVWLVYRKTCLNRQMAMATDPESGAVCRVKIQRSTNWVPGMEMKCVREKDDLYRHVGRAPRWRGRY